MIHPTPTSAVSRRLRAGVVVAALAIGVTACGGDDDDAEAVDAATAEETAGEETAGEETAADAEVTADEDTAETATDGDTAIFDLLPESVQESGSMTFGALWETPPTIGVDPSDTTTPVGVAPDMAEVMAELIGVEIGWENMQWPAQLPGVQAGTVDALFGQVTITEEREQSIVDLIPFGQQLEGILVPAGNPEGLTRLGDACGLTIGVPIGSTQGETLAAISDAACADDPIQSAEYQGASAAVSALQGGTIDGWMNTVLNQQAVVDAQPELFEVVVMPEDEKPATFSGIAVGKDQPGVSEAIVAAMEIMIEDGTYAAILDEWNMGPSAITIDQLVINPLTGTPVGEQAS